MNTLTQQHRAQQLLLRRATIAQLGKLWPTLDWTRLDATYPDFAVQVAGLVERNRQTSAGLASAYLRAFRKAQGIPGEVRVAFAAPLAVDHFNATLHSTSIAPAKAAAGRGVLADEAMKNARVLAAGAVARLVLNAGRETVTETIRRDRAAQGWQRVLGGTGCDFCRDLAGRTYATDSADFEAHGHCGCSAEPIYR